MRIKTYCENKQQVTYFEIDEEELNVMIETDYQIRLGEAEDKSKVQRRTAQEILDEEINKPTFNRNQTETRRHKHLEALDPQEDTIASPQNIENLLLKKEEYEELEEAIKKLTEKQRELIYLKYFKKMKQKDIAKKLNISEAAVSQRINTILKKLEKFLTEQK